MNQQLSIVTLCDLVFQGLDLQTSQEGNLSVLEPLSTLVSIHFNEGGI